MTRGARRTLGSRPHALGALTVAATFALLGCGTDVAQTAVYAGAPAPLDCAPPSTQVELPNDARFGGAAALEDWPLAKGDYLAGQGPGVTVAALDGFRLFVNGHLLATGTSSLVPTFVPLTF